MNQDKDKPINNFWGYLLVGGIFLFVLLLANDVPVPGEVLEAEIVGVHQYQSETPRPPVLLVKLENGATVPLAGSRRVQRKIGAKVRIQKYERKLLGMAHFRFIEFVED